MKGINVLRGTFYALGGISTLLFCLFVPRTYASTLSISPSSGSYAIGSTFDVSVVLNTQGKSVNAVKASLSFSPEILQVVSPSAGLSTVGVWASPPTYNNSTGKITLEGGFPNGANVSSALITKITFRVKGTGDAIVKFNDDSKVLLDNGEGSNDLDNVQSAVYSLTLPPPEGPEVVSETHPDQSLWYNKTSAVLKWADPDPSLVEKYSYTLSDNPTEIPDDTPEGDNNSIVYKDLHDSHHYFHIKALNKDGIWGGTTHYALNIDPTPPAEFSVDIFPGASTSRENPAIQFASTDNQPGIDHYELKIIPLGGQTDYVNANDSSGNQQMFIEANSPYLVQQNLALGSYDTIVRAYDKAGNYRDSERHLTVTNSILQFVGDEGLVIGGRLTVSWRWTILILLTIILALAYISYRLRSLHKNANIIVIGKGQNLPPEIQQKMSELKKLKEKYKKLAMIVALVLSSLFFVPAVGAESLSQAIEPPLITTVSKNISNDEIFYVGGKAENNGQNITIYIKNENTGETFNEVATANSKGEWFYRHDGFLSDGKYIMWAQSKIGEQLSPPSPQVEMYVDKKAFEFGSSRISYVTLLSLFIIALVLILLALVLYAGYFLKQIRKKDRSFKKEVKEVEDTVHKGFLMLHRDISKELQLVEKLKLKKKLSEKEKNYQQHLMNDLKSIERHIEKEITDVERLLS